MYLWTGWRDMKDSYADLEWNEMREQGFQHVAPHTEKKCVTQIDKNGNMENAIMMCNIQWYILYCT